MQTIREASRDMEDDVVMPRVSRASSTSKPGRTKADPAPQIRNADSYLRRISRISRRLLDAKFESGNDIWKMETGLLELQRDIQKSVTEAKLRQKRDRSAYADVKSLQRALWHARRLGDAIAWVLLGLNKQLIVPLSRNHRVPVSASEDHGSRGALIIAGYLPSQGWGFPILHDMTDCLRVGDITFVKPDKSIQTVEVKTRLVDERPNSDGTTHLEYQVTLLAAREIPEALISTANNNQSDEVSPSSPMATGRPRHRIERQIERLQHAQIQQDAKDNILTDVPGRPPLMAIRVEHNHSRHDDTFRRIVRKARRNGYASETVGNAILYAAFYRRAGVEEETIKDDRLASDLTSSGILFEDAEKERNRILISAIPDENSSGPATYLPYYLYSLPKTSIDDILFGRLIVVAITNMGRVVKNLEDSGFAVQYGDSGVQAEEAICGIASVYSDKYIEGQRVLFDFAGLGRHVNEMIHEFESPDHFVNILDSMFSAASSAREEMLKSGSPGAGSITSPSADGDPG